MRGAGWGHGIGLSQWGAYGYAKQGAGYRDILDHYYRDTQIETRDGGRGARAAAAEPPDRVLPRRDPGRRPGARRGLRSTRPRATGDQVVLRSATGRKLSTFDGMMRVVGGNARAAARTRRQRRARRPLPRRDRDPHRRRLGAERDQRARHGGLPARCRPEREPVLWPAAALQAQAVAARSYALASNVNGKGFNQYADTRSQVYRGYLGETPSTNAAVAATAGQVVTYGGDRRHDVLLLDLRWLHREHRERLRRRRSRKPWLKGVKDPYDDPSPYHRWGPSASRAPRSGAKLGSWVKGRFRAHQGARSAECRRGS